ncbi:hypothetical protein GGH18_004517, partial [Coemansia sp. RSA 530]
LEIAQVQLDIQQQLRSRGGHETPARALDERLYTVTELYDKFAEPLRLWDAVLLIFKASNHDDRSMVEEIWNAIVRTVLDDEHRTGLMAVSSKVSQLGRRLYPSAAAFPLDLLVTVLLDLAHERPTEYTPGFVADTLLQSRVPHYAAFEALRNIYKRVDMANTVAREIAALTAMWIDARGGSGDSQNMPVMDVDAALSLYIVNATLGNNIELKAELQRVQDRLRQVY